MFLLKYDACIVSINLQYTKIVGFLDWWSPVHKINVITVFCVIIIMITTVETGLVTMIRIENTFRNRFHIILPTIRMSLIKCIDPRLDHIISGQQ